MRKSLRYGAAIGIMASAFSTLGSVSASAAQIPGGAVPVTAVQQAGSPDKLHGQMAPQYWRWVCVRWGYRRDGDRRYYRYCLQWKRIWVWPGPVGTGPHQGPGVPGQGAHPGQGGQGPHYQQ